MSSSAGDSWLRIAMNSDRSDTGAATAAAELAVLLPVLVLIRFMMVRATSPGEMVNEWCSCMVDCVAAREAVAFYLF